MKQVLIKKVGVVVDEVPVPALDDNSILVETAYSLISVGTEVSSVTATRKTLVQQALEQPSKVFKVFDFVRREGLSRTIMKVQGITEAGSVTGYSCSGTVLAVGRNVTDIQVGAEVACAGAGRANHAEVVCVPRNLVVPLPNNCDLSDAASVTIGVIAMQGVRRADPKLGETVAVIGLGLIGQITVQLLKAAGCRVIGIDLDPRRIELGKQFGMRLGLNGGSDDVLAGVKHFSGGQGVDSVIITAASSSDAIVQQSMEICRRKGKVVVVGAVGLGLKRSPFYEKEIDFLISTSYGPGRYDPSYEVEGHDYPYAYVRWTENRNMQAYLQLIADGSLNIKALIERQYELDDAPKAYAELQGDGLKPLGVLLTYQHGRGTDAASKLTSKVILRPLTKTGRVGVAVVGAGSFAQGMHLPNLKQLGDKYHIRAVVNATGNNAKTVGQQFGAEYASTSYDEVLADPNVEMVLICTRHHLHAQQAIAAAKAGKAILLEKPMALNKIELDELVNVLKETGVPFMVGFNRRFSLYAEEARKHTEQRINPLFIHYRMNAGYIPLSHWVHGPEGGGRIIGEACHIIDLCNSLTGSAIRDVSVRRLAPKTESASARDNLTTTLTYDDGSMAVIDYFAVGSKQFAKENLEVHFDEKTIVIDDYKAIQGYGVKVKSISSMISEKGHLQELVAFHNALKTGKYPIPLWDLTQTTEATFTMEEAA
jgi:predicted dehydrogenase/threonine dehydrogenase-like Zn-dependent dehydrogenase